MKYRDTTFDVGIFAYFMYQNKVEFREIREMLVVVNQPIKYRFDRGNGKLFPFIPHGFIFGTKEELLASL
jgi:hypothetical protein